MYEFIFYIAKPVMGKFLSILIAENSSILAMCKCCNMPKKHIKTGTNISCSIVKCTQQKQTQISMT